MAFDNSITAFIPSFQFVDVSVDADITFTADSVAFPIASLDQLSATDISGAAADSRRLMFALCDHMAQFYRETPTADKPTAVTISKSSVMKADGTYRNTYTFVFDVDVLAQEVAA